MNVTAVLEGPKDSKTTLEKVVDACRIAQERISSIKTSLKRNPSVTHQNNAVPQKKKETFTGKYRRLLDEYSNDTRAASKNNSVPPERVAVLMVRLKEGKCDDLLHTIYFNGCEVELFDVGNQLAYVGPESAMRFAEGVLQERLLYSGSKARIGFGLCKKKNEVYVKQEKVDVFAALPGIDDEYFYPDFSDLSSYFKR